MMSEELIKIADSKIDDEHDLERMIRGRKWIMAKELPRKYGEMAAIPPPPPVEPMTLAIEDAKTITVKPNDDPIGEAIENFERALRRGGRERLRRTSVHLRERKFPQILHTLFFGPSSIFVV